MTDAEIAGHMNWSGPGAYTQHAMRRVKRMLEAAIAAEREACAKACEDHLAYPSLGPKDCAHAIRARGAP